MANTLRRSHHMRWWDLRLSGNESRQIRSRLLLTKVSPQITFSIRIRSYIYHHTDWTVQSITHVLDSSSEEIKKISIHVGCMESIRYHGDMRAIEGVSGSIETGRSLFVLVISYTHTCEIPGITVAGSKPEMLKYTPPADAEFIHSGVCSSIPGIPATPDGKPTPAVMTRVALGVSKIPHVVINAGGIITPQVPYVDTDIACGKNIAESESMTYQQAEHAIEIGNDIGSTLSKLCDCIILGESIPGGTTTALATLRGLGYQHSVSSSMPNNPVSLKEDIVSAALGRVHTTDDYMSMAAAVSDPMILFMAGMISGAYDSDTNVVLGGGTQMLAVLALARKIHNRLPRIVIATTTYVADDPATDFYRQAADITPDVGVSSANPHLDESCYQGLRAYADGFAKDGAGAGGMLFACAAHKRYPDMLLPDIDQEYARIMSGV